MVSTGIFGVSFFVQTVLFLKERHNFSCAQVGKMETETRSPPNSSAYRKETVS